MSAVIIVLATYNGESHLTEQLDSIISQSFADWHLLIRDDGSDDKTREILGRYSAADDRIEILDDRSVKTGSSVGNFRILAGEALARKCSYLFFADQDDVWKENKVERQLESLKNAEAIHGNIPCLVHSDLEVVDEKLSVIDGSFMHYQGLRDEKKNPLGVLLVQNYVTGCSVAINRKLLEMSMPFPDGIIMHDWWLAQCAAASGRIVFLPEPLLKYRQHGGNVVGAKGYWALINPFSVSLAAKWSQGQKRLTSTIIQAKQLSIILQEKPGYLSANAVLQMVIEYSRILDVGAYKRLALLYRYGIGRQRYMMNLAFILRLLFTRRVS